jgi:polyphosphate kinase
MAVAKRPNKARMVENEKSSETQVQFSGKDYERELARLHGELVKLQLWVVAKGLKVVILFEGRDGAGKGGVIKAITERVSPSRLSRRRAACADRAREVADVCAAVYASSACGRRDRDL